MFSMHLRLHACFKNVPRHSSTAHLKFAGRDIHMTCNAYSLEYSLTTIEYSEYQVPAFAFNQKHW
jgi:hypothetical protein